MSTVEDFGIGSTDDGDELEDLGQRTRPYRALYEHWEAHQWSALDLDYSEDARSFQALDEERREGFLWIFSHRFHAEFNVATVLAPFVMRAPSYDLQVCLATQLADEFRHMQSVLRVYDEVFGIHDMQRVRAIADSHMDPVAATMYARFQECVRPLEHSDDPDDFLRASVGYHVLGEGVVARTSQNLAAGTYAKYGSFPGLTAGQRLVARDEARHIGIGVSYCRERMLENRAHTTQVIGEVVEEFTELAADLLQTALAGRMDSQVVSGYGVEPEGFYLEAMRLFQVRLRSIGFLTDDS